MYILMCGYPPFNGETDEAIFREVVSGTLMFDPMEWGVVSKS
jgi:calcium-dependent protein kinase